MANAPFTNLAGSSFRRLIDDLRAGREAAAAQVVQTYGSALRTVAQRRIGPQLGRRLDAEDALQSVFRSVLMRFREGRYEVDNGDDLWKLLLTVTLNKVRRKARFHAAERRDVSRERGDVDAMRSNDRSWDSGFTPDEAAAIKDFIGQFVDSFPAWAQPIVEMRLHGYSTPDIARHTGRPERSVRRFLVRVRERLAERARDFESP